MSGYFVDADEDEPIRRCGNVARIGKKTCYECDLDLQDLYSEMKYQDSVEGD